MFEYPINVIKDDNGTWRTECPDVPEMHSFGDSKEDAIHNSQDALEAALSFYIDRGESLPKSSRKGSTLYAYPTMQGMMKLAIYQAMRDQKVKRVTMAKLLNVAPTQVDRLIDLTHASRMDQLENALQALGKRFFMKLEDA